MATTENRHRVLHSSANQSSASGDVIQDDDVTEEFPEFPVRDVMRRRGVPEYSVNISDKCVMMEGILNQSDRRDDLESFDDKTEVVYGELFALQGRDFGQGSSAASHHVYSA